MKKVLFHTILLITAVSCVTREICDEDNQSDLVARFKVEKDGNVSDTTFSSVSVYGIRSGEEFGLLYDTVPTSRIVLPLDQGSLSTTYVIDFGSQSDTLIIHHDTEYYLISYTCGFAALFSLEDPEHSGDVIRDIQVISPVVDAEMIQNEEHLWLYF